MRAENDVRLRLDLLEGQASSIAKMLAKAIRNHNEHAFKEYAERLAANRGRIEELLRVLGEKAGQGVLDLQIAGNGSASHSVKEIIEKLKNGEIKMDDLPADAQALVRKGALESKNASKS